MATWYLHTQCGTLNVGNPDFLMVTKHAHTFALERETIFLFRSSPLYIKILEKIVQKKGKQCLYLEDMQKHEKLIENYL